MQVKVFENAINNMEEQAKKELPLIEAYYMDSLTLFKNEFLKPFDFSNSKRKQAYNLVFTERNKSWVEKIEKYASEAPGTYFVLVGAGHYFGPDNIRAILEQKGYAVEKI